MDGLRAVAVLAVLLYHADLSWIPGGFLGVDVFFVISGYLITMLLLEEHRHRGGISIKKFYGRRARRLLPALYLLLVVVCAVALVFYRDELSRLRSQLISALTYSTNWYLIVSDGSYFLDLGRPLVLRHLWSLAVEEQFYLLWPLALVLLLRRFQGRVGPIALAITGATAASALWMAVLYRSGSDPSRVYYGTDTRLSTLLIGALLALFWRPSALAHGRVRLHGRLFDVVGVLALAGLVWWFVNATDTGATLYRGGFVVVAILSALAVAAASHPATAFGRVLGVGVLTWVGVRSYALYLWHWPIYVITRPHVDVPFGGLPVLGMRLGLTFLLADLSYRLVERPIRRVGFRHWVRRSIRLGSRGQRRPLGLVVFGATLAGFAALVLVIVGGQRSRVNDIEASLRAGQAAIEASGSGSGVRVAPATSAASPVRARPAAVTTSVADGAINGRPLGEKVTTAVVEPAVATTAATTVATTLPATTAAPVATPPPAPPPPGPIVALGDSVMLGAAPQLLATFGPGTLVDAQVGRTLWPVVGIVATLRAENRLGERVVLHLGDNGGVDPNLIAQTMASLADVDRVVWVNVKVPRSWEAGVNQTLAAEIPKYPNARLLDWKGLATDESMFYEDGIHLRPSGAAFYAEQVRAALAQP